jgi:hypothetical protein
MSLHKFAEQVASQGRGDDSLLVHMTPDEVRNLQKFAQANGTTLTINPETGLPEAGLLSDLFKAVAPLALGAFLGPGAFGIAGLGLSAGTAGLVTGGLTTLATGSLSRGLMAGLGAYGGAGLAESFMGAGVGAAQQSAMGALTQDQITAQMAESGLTQQGVLNQAAADATKSALTNTGQAVSSGFNAATATPAAMGAFAKQNLGNLAYAAAPIAAGLMVPTTTKLPDPKDTGRIRQMAFNINPDTGRPDPLYGMREMPVVKTSEFGDKTFKGQRDLFYQQNSNPYQNPYQLGVGSLNQPPQQQQITPMAGGGIVALAGGGDVVRMAGGTPPAMLSDEALYQKTGSWEAAAAARDAQNNALNAYNWNQQAQAKVPELINQSINNATSTQNALLAAKDYVNTAATPTTTTEQFVSGAQAKNIGLTQELQTALANSGLSAAAQYALTHANIGSPLNTEETYGGLKGLSSNINYGVDTLRNAGLTGISARENALAEMNKYGINEADIKRATGKTLKELFPDTVTKIDDKTTVTGGTDTGTGTGGTGTGVTTVTPQPFTSVIPGGFYGNATNPGDITTNSDGTVTVHPNIPYRPPGGFSGIEEVSDAYTKGGGSLGYTSPVVKTPAEHAAAYNKLTDDSLDAYRFLMGEGKNLTQRKAETRNRPVMQRYDEAVLGRKIAKPGANTTTTTKSVVGVPGNPQSYFDEAAYLAANPDVAEEIRTGKSVSGKPTQFTSGYQHYLMYGKAGGRAFTGDYEGYLTAAALADAANATNTGGGGDGPAPPGPGPDSTSPANSDPGGDVAKTGGLLPRGYAIGGGLGSLGSYSDGGRLLKGPGDGVSDSIPATIGRKQQPARLADGEFVIPARIVSELGNGSTEAGAKKLYAMMDRVQRARRKTTGKNKVAANSRSDKYLPA